MKKHKGALKNSTVYADHKGDYVVVSRDADGRPFKVYISYLPE